MNKISVVTGTRAEYGLLSNLVKLINQDKNFKLQLIVTGSHLLKKYGETYNEIKKDQIVISKKINILSGSDSENSIIDATSNALSKIGYALKKFSPKALIILGDRYEILGAAIAANFLRIPIYHFHGGERTEGLIDESIRHAISKMSTLHFVANSVYRKRVIQLGEKPNRVFNVGGMGIDVMRSTKNLSKKKLSRNLNIKFKDKIFLVTYHPVTLENSSAELQFKNLLNALLKFKNVNFIFTSPNSDANNNIIIHLIKEFVKKNSNAYFFESLGKEKYYSMLKIVDLVIGNSSSGIIEVPYFNIPTINIGDRQNGRLKAKSIIDCKPQKKSIIDSINLSLTKKFINICAKNDKFYGTGGSGKKSFKIIKKLINKVKIKKEFYDIDFKI
jgi:GDP/UDP-N,N'-diacetylbacillosamine 2-epimerase (hydrolysing)